MASEEHPTKQPITAIDGEGGYYTVGSSGVTKIEPFVKSGMYSDIAYIRVWKGEFVLAEFCQHNLTGVYFEAAAAA